MDLSEEFAHEKLSPVLAMYRAKDFRRRPGQGRAADRRRRLRPHLLHLPQRHHPAGEARATSPPRMKTCRILVNTPSSQGGIGDLYNFKLAPSLTLGCGSWGGNSVSENVGVKHLLNIKTVAERRENMLWFRAPEKVYLKKGCLPVALDELKHGHGQEEGLHRHRLPSCTTTATPRPSPTSWTRWACSTPPSSTWRPIPPWPAPRKAPSAMNRLPARLHHRPGRRLRHGRGQDHVGDVRASGRGLPGYGHALHGHPQAHLHLPQDGREGLLHRDPHLRRHRLRGDALRGHHRRDHRREVSAGRL